MLLKNARQSFMIERQLARFALADVPDAPLKMVRLSLFDWMACGIAGASEPIAKILRNNALEDFGNVQSSLFGGGKAPIAQAALVNGATSHALDYDDTHFAHIGHTSVAVMPAALAVGEATGADIYAVLQAALIGAEAAVRIGLWLGRDHYQVGFHQTATSGAFGACIAAARLLDASEAQVVMALGLVSTRAAGLKAQFGTMGKPLNAGLAAQAGVEAARWAVAGMTSTAQGVQRFGEVHHGAANMDGFDGMGDLWLMDDVSHKFHACCHGLHAAIEAADKINVDAKDIDKVEVFTNIRWMTVCNLAAPKTGLEAKFSYVQVIAMHLVGMNTGAISVFNDAVVHDPAILALRARINVCADSSLSEMQARIRVTLGDGSVIEVAHDLDAPMPLDVRLQKLRLKADGLGAGGVWDVVQGNDLAALTQMMQQ